MSTNNTSSRPVVEMLDDDNVSFKRPSQAKEILRRLRKNKGAMVGLVLLIFILLVVIFADVIVSYDAGVVQVPDNKLAPMSAEHPLGCDSYGRDVLSRLVHGARNSLLVAVAASISSCLVGCTLGAIAGYFGGKVDMIIMRALDIFMSIPDLLFTMVVALILGCAVPPAAAYALCAFMAAYAWNLMWTDCMVLAPLVVLGLERLIRDNRPGLYYVSLAVCILSNYYISIMICIFLVLWFLFLNIADWLRAE